MAVAAQARGSTRGGRRTIGAGWIIATYVLLLIFTLWTVIPFLWMFLASIKTNKEIYNPEFTIFPKQVFLGHYDGTFSAYDAKSLQELWSFNMGTGINAPAVTYSVNGKQYVAVLVGSRQALNVWQNAPELKNTATASMLYVFEQQ